MRVKLSSKQKTELREQLYIRDGRNCSYCGIAEEDFCEIWGDTFYGGIKRGRILEIDRIDNNKGYSDKNCILACALCNMAKSDKFTSIEFILFGRVIKDIWEYRMKQLEKEKVK